MLEFYYYLPWLGLDLSWWELGLEGGNYRSYKVIMFRKCYKSSTWSRAASMPGAAGWQSFLSNPMFTDLWLNWRAEAGPVTVNLNASDNCEDSSSWCLQTNKTSQSPKSRHSTQQFCQFYTERIVEALFCCFKRDLERCASMLNTGTKIWDLAGDEAWADLIWDVVCGAWHSSGWLWLVTQIGDTARAVQDSSRSSC